MRLERKFFRQDACSLGKNLLGKVLCVFDKKYRIVEVEAYMGVTDRASHAYNNKRTSRTEVMYADGGCLYVYLIYGMYYLLNIVASVKDTPEAVLIRAVEPMDGEHLVKYTNGPGKLCKYIGIDKTFNGLDLTISSDVYIEDDGYYVQEIVTSKRINVDYALEDKDKPWRFYIKNSSFVSQK